MNTAPDQRSEAVALKAQLAEKRWSRSIRPISERWMSGEELLTASGIGDVPVEILVGVMPGDLPCPEQFLPLPPGHPCKSRRLPGGEDAPLVERQWPRSRCNSAATVSGGSRSACTISWGTVIVTSAIAVSPDR